MPVSIAPPKLWVVALFHNTYTKDSFLQHETGVLQLLIHAQANLVPILGQHSGYDTTYSKQEACQQVGWNWVEHLAQPSIHEDEVQLQQQQVQQQQKQKRHFLIPGCASYIQIKLLSTIDAGDHVLAMTQVVQTGVWNETTHEIVFGSATTSRDPAATTTTAAATRPPLPPARPLDETTVLYTGRLRQLGIL
jgi:flavin reductase (DIM6/NTAB) family NADH-FMN oxidoreductase RutF